MCRKKTVLLFVVFLIYLLNLSSAQEAKEATFTGRVLDAQGRHVAEAIVKFYDGKYTQSLYTTDIAEPEEKKIRHKWRIFHYQKIRLSLWTYRGRKSRPGP